MVFVGDISIVFMGFINQLTSLGGGHNLAKSMFEMHPPQQDSDFEPATQAIHVSTRNFQCSLAVGELSPYCDVCVCIYIYIYLYTNPRILHICVSLDMTVRIY